MHGEKGVRSVGGAETGSRRGEVCAVGDNESSTTSKGAKTKSALGYEKPIVFDKIFFCSYCLPKIQVKT